MEKTGFIYVLTNESFHRDNWIKIGYADDVDRRVRELSGTAVPLPYEVYCTYEIPRMQGIKDPDKLLHDLIAKLNPNLRISPNREFFEMFPWDAYDMLFAIAQMHGRSDKLALNKSNNTSQEIKDEGDYSVDALYPAGSEITALYEKLKKIVKGLEPQVTEVPQKFYVSFKKNNSKVVALWPRSGCIEVVMHAKLGQINDNYGLTYDISNRQWTAEQYAFKFYADTDVEAVKDLIGQVLGLTK